MQVRGAPRVAHRVGRFVASADRRRGQLCTFPNRPQSTYKSGKAVQTSGATSDSRGGQHVRSFLGLPGTQGKPAWQGKLVTDDFSGYKACFELGVTEVGCMAHARRKFHELWVNHGSQVGEQALKFFAALCDVEREVADADSQARLDARRRSRPVADALHQWMRQQRQKIPGGSATARAIDFYEAGFVKPLAMRALSKS